MTHILFILLIVFNVISCSKDKQSRPNFNFKSSNDSKVVARAMGKDILADELYKGIRGEIYDKESKLYKLKEDRLKVILLNMFMDAHPKKKGLTNDQFLNKFIATNVVPSSKDVEKFAEKRNIPKQQLNDKFRQRISNYLEMENKKKAINKWIDRQTKKYPVDIYFKKPVRPVFNISIDNSPVYGKSSAKVTLVEFSDFQCPYCAKGVEIIKKLKKKYKNKLKVVFKNFPLQFHKHARPASIAAMCTWKNKGDNAFWKIHNLMFSKQDSLDDNGLVKLLAKVGLSKEDLDRCKSSSDIISLVDRDIKQGIDLGLKSTPTFFINGKMVSGAVAIEEFSKIIDEDIN